MTRIHLCRVQELPANQTSQEEAVNSNCDHLGERDMGCVLIMAYHMGNPVKLPLVLASHDQLANIHPCGRKQEQEL